MMKWSTDWRGMPKEGKKTKFCVTKAVPEEKNTNEIYAIGYSIDNLVGAKNLTVHEGTNV